MASTKAKVGSQSADAQTWEQWTAEPNAENAAGVDPVLLRLSSPVFWKKSITPIFVISKEDVKNLALPGFAGNRRGGSTTGPIEGDPLSNASTSVIGLSVNFTGASKDAARASTQHAMEFIVDGASFIYCEGLIKSYNSELATGLAGVNRDIAKARVDLVYQEKWVKHLYQMAQRHPKSLKEESIVQLGNKTELMSLETQIVVAENDVQRTQDNLSRLTDRQTELRVLGLFVERAAPLLTENLAGRLLTDKLLAIVDALKHEEMPEENVKFAAIGRIEADITAIKVRFNQGFSEGKITTEKSLVKQTLFGLGGGAFLALMAAIVHRVLRRYREEKSIQKLNPSNGSSGVQPPG